MLSSATLQQSDFLTKKNKPIKHKHTYTALSFDSVKFVILTRLQYLYKLSINQNTWKLITFVCAVKCAYLL